MFFNILSHLTKSQSVFSFPETRLVIGYILGEFRTCAGSTATKNLGLSGFQIFSFGFADYSGWTCYFGTESRPDPDDAQRRGSSRLQRARERQLAHTERPARVREAKGR